MKTIDRACLLLAAGAFFLLMGCESAPPTGTYEDDDPAFALELEEPEGKHGPVTASVRGGGHYFVEVDGEDGEVTERLRHTSVVALKYEDESVRGQLEVRDPSKDDPTRIHARIVCLTVEGERAWLGGVVTDVDAGEEIGAESEEIDPGSDEVELEVGSEMGLVLHDRAEARDQLTEVIRHDPNYETDDLAEKVCRNRPWPPEGPPLHEIDAGNLTVAGGAAGSD